MLIIVIMIIMVMKPVSMIEEKIVVHGVFFTGPKKF